MKRAFSLGACRRDRETALLTGWGIAPSLEVPGPRQCALRAHGPEKAGGRAASQAVLVAEVGGRRVAGSVCACVRARVCARARGCLCMCHCSADTSQTSFPYYAVEGPCPELDITAPHFGVFHCRANEDRLVGGERFSQPCQVTCFLFYFVSVHHRTP